MDNDSHLRPTTSAHHPRCSAEAPTQRHEPPPDPWLEPLRVTETARPPIFDWSVVARSFDRAAFERDGLVVFESLWLPAARAKLQTACARIQQLDADFAGSDWASVEWEQIGLTRPARPEQWATARRIGGHSPPNPPGYTDDTPGWPAGWPEAMDNGDVRAGFCGGPRYPFMQGYMPSQFPPAHDPFLLDCMTHPQMLALHRLLLGTPEIRMDHMNCLNRKPPFGGGSWHPHSYPGAGDDDPPSTDHQPLQVVRTLCYPAGFAAHEDGGLGLVPGSHLFGSELLLIGRKPRQPARTDAELEAGWLKGRRHPATGELLRIERRAFPPGSMASLLTRTLHGVAPKPEGETRWAALFAYASVAPAASQARRLRHFPFHDWQIELGIPGAERLMMEF